jgi:phage terminase large subunit-like protein
VTAYAKDVAAGRVIAGWLVRLACARHLRDMVEGPRRGLTWDLSAALHVIGFFGEVLKLNGGQFEGKPFILGPWEAFIVGSLFGWKGPDGFRRFRTAYLEIGKGNGKSPIAAGIGHFMLLADGEARAEVYAAASKKDQAMILFRDAVAMWQQSPALQARLKPSGTGQHIWNLAYLEQSGFFRPISSDDGQSGPRPHCGLLDEIHEHKDSQVADLMRAGTKFRRQALIVEITNSGLDRQSICYNHHDYSIDVLQAGKAADQGFNDSWFAYVCTLDPCETCRAEGARQPTEGCDTCDDWRDSRVWKKANPNLGVSITEKYLSELVREAEGMPAKQNVVKRLNFCIWVQEIERAIPMDAWDRAGAPLDPATLRGRRCFAGLDLARVDDLSALALLFPPVDEGEPWAVLPFFWCPADNVVGRSKNGVPYDVWVRDGLITATPGNVTDYAFIRTDILELAGLYQIEECVFDRTFAGEIIQELESEGLTMVQFGQGFLSMAAPSAELLRLVKSADLHHGGNPVLRWNASNLVMRVDPAGNLKPDKERSRDKIDGMTALCNALGRAQLQSAGTGWRPI